MSSTTLGCEVRPLGAQPVYFSPSQVARMLPSSKGDKPVHPATVLRWRSRGVPLSDGTRVYLEGVRYPSGWKFTREALDAFLAAITEDRGGLAAAPARTTTQQRRASIAAERELARVGV